MPFADTLAVLSQYRTSTFIRHLSSQLAEYKYGVNAVTRQYLK